MRTAFFFLVLTTSLAAADPKPVRLVAEAEDFTPTSGDWKIIPFRENSFASSFAVTFLSRMACLGAAAQADAVATQQIDLPADGEFQVFARYEQPFNFAAEFTVEISQNNAAVYRETFGKLADPKIWAFNNHARVPMERYGWGGTDNIVWQQQKAVMLKKGPATLRLIAAPQPGRRAADRHVDAILLTNDAAGLEAQKKATYLELDGWLTQAGDLFVRFMNPSDGLGPCVPLIAPETQGQHSPYYVHVRDWPTTRVLKAGLLTEDIAYQNAGPRLAAVKSDAVDLLPEKYFKPVDPKNPKSPKTVTFVEADYLLPGQSTGWVPMGQVLDSLNNSTWRPQAVYKNDAKGLKLKLEFAVPDGAGGYRVVKEKTLTAPEAFEIPGNVNPSPALAKMLQERQWTPTIRTQKEAVQWLLSEVKEFPQRGSVPKRFLLYNVMGFGGRTFDDPAVKELAKALADNTWQVPDSAKRDLVAHLPDPTPAAITKYEAGRKGGFANVRVVSYGDEIHLPPMEVTNAEFNSWLKARGVTTTPDVNLIKNDKSAPMYYYSQLCMKEKGGAHYAAGTKYYRDRGVFTGANYSPHANYLVSDLDYVRPFKLKAMSLPWGEDYVWGVPEFSPQATGFLVSGFRAGAKYDRLPIHFYVMPHSPGTTPGRFRLSFYTAVAHGTKEVDYFCASPLAIGATENYIATDDLGMWKAVRDAGHDAGTFEDYVIDGTVRPAKVGLLLSSVDEILTGVNNFSLALHNNERKALYYALRHAQVPVDFVTEDDLIAGLKDYRTVYVGQQFLHSKAVDALQKFAESGGTVVATAGGGFRDEFGRPNPKANAFYGVSSQELTTDPDLVPKYLLKENQPFFAKQDLPVYEPMDTVAWAGQSVPVIAWKQRLTAADGKVVGAYRDGSPAVVEKPHGKGRVVLFGFLPGQAYLKSALPLRPVDRSAVDSGYDHFLPTAMDAKLRTALTDDFLGPNFAKPVVCSEPLVETTCIDTPGKLAVPLLNYTGKAIPTLTVRIAGLTGAKKIRSVERGDLKAQERDGATVVTLPLDVADMLLVDR